MNLTITADNVSRALFTTRLHAHVTFMNNNSCDYSSFDMYFVSNYINNQKSFTLCVFSSLFLDL